MLPSESAGRRTPRHTPRVLGRPLREVRPDTTRLIRAGAPGPGSRPIPHAPRRGDGAAGRTTAPVRNWCPYTSSRSTTPLARGSAASPQMPTDTQLPPWPSRNVPVRVPRRARRRSVRSAGCRPHEPARVVVGDALRTRRCRDRAAAATAYLWCALRRRSQPVSVILDVSSHAPPDEPAESLAARRERRFRCRSCAANLIRRSRSPAHRRSPPNLPVRGRRGPFGVHGASDRAARAGFAGDRLLGTLRPLGLTRSRGHLGLTRVS